MDKAYDLVVRGGTVADGSGEPLFEADVAVKDGRVAAVGKVSGSGTEEIDARGRVVAPGFVDVHTHYDGQVTWAERMQPSSWHGVTTVVMGNCGVGFAPCKPSDRDRLIELMEGVEDIPFAVLADGLPWDWETYPEYLDSLSRQRFDVDVGSQLPHSAVRVFVMGERGAQREPATPEDIRAMAAIARQAVEAGALGFCTSRTLNHRTVAGELIPTLTAGEDELTGIAMALSAAGKGVLQVVADFEHENAEFAMLRRVVEASGRPLAFSLLQSPTRPQLYRDLLAKLGEALDAGLPMRAQVATRPVGVLFGLETSLHPFTHHPSYLEVAHLPLAERVKALSDPDRKARLLCEKSTVEKGFAGKRTRRWDDTYLMLHEPNYEPTYEQTVAAIAARRGVQPEEVALDQLLSGGGTGLLMFTHLNYAERSLDPSYEMLSHRGTVPGLSDGGAHVGMICDGSFPTSNITHWSRDRNRGPKLPLERMIKAQARDTAVSVGLMDRGLLRPGYRADLNVIDYQGLRLEAPEVTYDLPTGGKRLVQRAKGYMATVVAGQVTYRDGEATGALPGRLLRGAQEEPVATAAE